MSKPSQAKSPQAKSRQRGSANELTSLLGRLPPPVRSLHDASSPRKRRSRPPQRRRSPSCPRPSTTDQPGHPHQSGHARGPRRWPLPQPHLHHPPHQTGQLFTPPVSLFIGYFPTQRTGQSIHSPQNCLPGAGWTFASSKTIYLERPELKNYAGRRVSHHQRLRQAGCSLLVSRSRPQHRQRLRRQGLHDAGRHSLQPHRRRSRPPRHAAPAQRIRSHRPGPRHQVCRSSRTHAAPFHPQLTQSLRDPRSGGWIALKFTD